MATISFQHIGNKVLLSQTEFERLVELASRAEETVLHDDDNASNLEMCMTKENGRWNKINLCLESTDMPDISGGLPINAVLSMENNNLRVEAKRSGTLAGDISYEFCIAKNRIQSTSVHILPDVPDD